MKFSIIIILVLIFSFGFTNEISCQIYSHSDNEVIDLGSRLEPFVDTFIIEQMDGTFFELHSPILYDTAIIFNEPWEGNANHFVTVFKDQGIYKMYYRSTPGIVDASGKGWELMVCYAESTDGIHFTKPNLGIISFNESKNNNIILRDKNIPFAKSPFQNFTPFIDNNPHIDPSERYKATGGASGGLFTFTSADGIKWTKSKNPILSDTLRPKPNNLFDSQNVCFWDSIQNQYVLFLRDMYKNPETGSIVRGIRRSVSKDFDNWSDPVWISYSNEHNDEFYTNSITPYFRAPHIYFGFPMRFMQSRNAKIDNKYDKYRGQGVSDAVFMSSRDGKNWDRKFHASFITPGLDPKNWTDRNNAVALGLLPIDSNYMSLYVLQHFRLPSVHIKSGRIRLDGISSVSASNEIGEIITKPLTFEGQNLVLNYSTSAIGRIRVEIQDISGQPIEGFELKNSKIYFGDKINEIISWDGYNSLKKLINVPVRIRIEMKEAKLYSLHFSDN